MGGGVESEGWLEGVGIGGVIICNPTCCWMAERGDDFWTTGEG